MLCGTWRNKLADEISLNEFFIKLAKEVNQQDKNKRNEHFREKLLQLKDIGHGQKSHLPEVFIYPHDIRLKSSAFDISSCKVFSSKKSPLYIQSFGVDQASLPCMVMFKLGDDLRQDILTLQLIEVIDHWWLIAGIDFKMKPYRVISTKDQIGFVEIVKQSDTVEAIHKKYGGSLGALDKNTIKKYLETSNKEAEFDLVFENFRRSVAGYCIATYVLGIYDRHVGNYMVSKNGYFFHIDFGHIFGDYKKKFGIKRERSKVVLTKEILYAIGNVEDEAYFYNLVVTGFNILRKKSNQ